MMRNARRGLTFAAVACVMTTVTARGAAAEPVDTANWVTSGSYFTQDNQDFFSFISPQLSFEATSGATPDKVWASTCSLCAPGDTVNMSFRHTPLDANGFTQFVDLGSGHGHVLDGPDTTFDFSGSFKFNATPIAFPDLSLSTITLSTPFSFRGWLNAMYNSGPNAGSGGYGMRLRGLGTATLTFTQDGSGYRAVGNPTYTFSAATPEPSSLLLLGSGILALVRRRRTP